MRQNKNAMAIITAGIIALAGALAIADEPIPFTEDRWDLSKAEVVTHLGRDAVQGVALLRDAPFENGIIAVDVAVTGERSYPGVVFRAVSDDTYERVYLRPHRAGLYPDSLQYAPIFSGVACWQLFHGEGNASMVHLAPGQWTSMRIEICGGQARVFVGDVEQAQLTIRRLQHGARPGAVGVLGPANGTAYFSNFSFTPTDDIAFEPAQPEPEDPLAIHDWEVSRVFPAGSIDTDTYPRFYRVFGSRWEHVRADPSGLVNLSAHKGHAISAPATVFARTFVHSDRTRRVKLSLGYSDSVTVFVNGQPLYSGQNGYRSRDPSFVGVLGPFDAVHATLRPGRNEIFLMISDSFGGWGFRCTSTAALQPPVRQHSRARPVWETEDVFDAPESVLHDRDRQVLYVSSFNKVDTSKENAGYISRVSLDGVILDHRWVDGLDGPCGMALLGDKLYVVESFLGNLVEISTESEKLLRRIPVPFEHRFLNDIAAAPDGRLFISNTTDPGEPDAHDIFVFEDDAFRVWETGASLHRVNGLCAHGDELLIGNTGSGSLVTGALQPLLVGGDAASLGAGVVDGIRRLGDGSALVSLWQGLLFRVSPDGEAVEILNLYERGLNCADFEYIEDQQTVVIPTFLGNKVVAYSIREG